MKRTAACLLTSTLIAALAFPFVVSADDDDDHERGSRYLDRDIDQDRARIRNEERDLRRDYGRLREEQREGDWADAEAIRDHIARDERKLARDRADVRRDTWQRRERDDDD